MGPASAALATAAHAGLALPAPRAPNHGRRADRPDDRAQAVSATAAVAATSAATLALCRRRARHSSTDAWAELRSGRLGSDCLLRDQSAARGRLAKRAVR